jgi:hypothetical protein
MIIGSNGDAERSNAAKVITTGKKRSDKVVGSPGKEST